MAKLEIGEFVWMLGDPKGEFARVIGREGRSYHVFTSRRRQVTTDVRRLRSRKPTILVLESSLPDGREALRSDRRRQSGVFLEEFFKSMQYGVLSERVHTVKSLEYFMKHAHHEDVVAVHWNGHGYVWESEPTANRITALILSADRLYLPEDDEAYLRGCLDRGTWRKQHLTPLEEA